MHSSLFTLWRKLALTKKFQLGLMRVVNDKFLIGVTGIIFNNKNEVLLVKHSYRRVPWSLPGGYLKGKEHPKTGLAREIYEETHLSVVIEKIIKTTHDESSAHLDMCYIGKFKGGNFQKSDEVVDYGFYDRKSLPPLIDDQYEQIDLAYQRLEIIHPNSWRARLGSLISGKR